MRRWRKCWAEGNFRVDDLPGRGRKPSFTPLDKAIVQAIACEIVARTKHPLSRQSLADVTAQAQQALNKPISRSTEAANFAQSCN